MKTFVVRDNHRKWYVSGTDTGFMSQDAYLYCAAAKLSTVIIGLATREALHEIMALKEHERVVYTQVVGKSLKG